MTETIWQSIAITPWWIFLFGGYVIWASLQAIKPRLIPIKQLGFMALLFVGLSIMTMCAMLQAINIVPLSIWAGTVFLGTGLGYLHFHFLNVKTLKNAQAVELPGSWLFLITLILLLITKFYFGFSVSISPQMLLDPNHVLLIVFAYGLLTGLSLGRFSYALVGISA